MKNTKSKIRRSKVQNAEAQIDFSMFLDNYLEDAKEGFQTIINALLVLEKDHHQTGRLDEVFRAVHTLKSSSTMLGFSNITELAHVSEDILDQLRKHKRQVSQEAVDLLFEIMDTLENMVRERAEKKKKSIADWGSRILELKSKIENPKLRNPQSAIRNPQPVIEKIQTVRVHVDLLDSLFNLVGELRIIKNRVDTIVLDNAEKELKAALNAMDHMISEVQENVSAARLVSVDEIFQKFPRMVRDLAKDGHKEVELDIKGRDIELDKAVLDAMSEPLVHLLRNAVDHGIETADIRRKHQKKKFGTIQLIAERSENHIVIHVEDDGNGIDTTHMRQLFIKKGFIHAEEADRMEDREVLDILFRPGVSSAEKVTDLSGRGVGLDVVRTSIKKMGGTIDVESRKGHGTRFVLTLPLTTAIIQTLMVNVGKHIFAIPSDIVQETLEVTSKDIKKIRNDYVLVLREKAIPFVRLDEALHIRSREDQESLIAVILVRGGHIMGLGVDTVMDQMENIIKPFGPMAPQFKGFSGGTILGDGRVALLLDIPFLLDTGMPTESILGFGLGNAEWGL